VLARRRAVGESPEAAHARLRCDAFGFKMDLAVVQAIATFRAYAHSSVFACNLLVIARQVLAMRA
jgi:hypothetical protein